MRGPDADKEREAFDVWHAVPANAEAYAGIEATWDDSLFLANRSVGRQRDLARARTRKPLALIAAGMAAIMIFSGGLLADRLGWFGSPAGSPVASVEYAAAGTDRMVLLADGSHMMLDHGSMVRDLSSPGERRFLLLRGRARFDVAHDGKRPFVVDAGEGRVVAHGTLFDVGLEGKLVRVILLRGSIEVQGREAGSTKRGAFLRPGEELLVGRGTVGRPARTDPVRLAWPNAMVSFDDMPLGQAIAAFNRTSALEIRLEKGAPSSQRLTGSFRRDDPRGFSDAVAASFGLEVDGSEEGSLVLRTASPGR